MDGVGAAVEPSASIGSALAFPACDHGLCETSASEATSIAVGVTGVGEHVHGTDSQRPSVLDFQRTDTSQVDCHVARSLLPEEVPLPSDSSSASDREEVNMWNQGFLVDALAECHPRDTSVDASTVRSQQSCEDRSCQVLSMTVADNDAAGGVVERTVSDVPEDVGQTDVYGFLEDGEEELPVTDPAKDSESSSPTHDFADGEALWRLPVRVLNFQRLPVYDILFVSPSDSLDEVIRRAEPSLKPAGDFFELVAPHYQPSADCLTLLCFPAWWGGHGIQAFVVSEGSRPGDPFLQVRHPDDELSDTYIAGDVDASVEEGQDLPGRNSLFFVQDSGLPAPSFITALEVIRDRMLDTPVDQLPRVIDPHPTQNLLLGDGFDQMFVNLHTDFLPLQLAAATKIPESNLAYWAPQGSFEVAAVCGWPVGRVLGIRDRRHIRQNNSCTLFIDARTLGRPLCCRVLPSCQASLSQLLAAIDVSLPDSITPEIVGGDIVWGRPDVRRFRHCSIVILWARDARDSLSSSPAVLPSDSSHEAEDPGGDDLSDGVDGCRDDGFQAGLSTARDENRSRSPARGGPAQGGSSGPAVLDDAGSKARGCCVKRVQCPRPAGQLHYRR